MKFVNIEVFGIWSRDDFIPFDGFDVAQIVVVQNANATFQNIPQSR